MDKYKPRDNIFHMAAELNQLGKKAYQAYLPIVEDLCSRDVPEEELAYFIDYILDFAYDEQILELFKQLCRRYVYIYPDSIKFYIEAYREMWDIE